MDTNKVLKLAGIVFAFAYFFSPVDLVPGCLIDDLLVFMLDYIVNKRVLISQ